MACACLDKSILKIGFLLKTVFYNAIIFIILITRTVKMDSVNKTLYIPLYGKALVSKKGVILTDKKAEEIWQKVQFPLTKNSKSKWLAYFLGMRSAVFDEWTTQRLLQTPNAVVLHLGCGLDSRVERVSNPNALWFDVDFEQVINERKLHYTQTPNYQMISADLKTPDFIDDLPQSQNAIVILEGVSMYLSVSDLYKLFTKITTKYPNVNLLIDCYTTFAVNMSKLKNPVNEVGINNLYGIDDPLVLTGNSGLKFTAEHSLSPDHLISQLTKFEQFIFKTIYAGKTAKKLYKLYEFETLK